MGDIPKQLEGMFARFKAGLPQVLKTMAQRGAAVYGGELASGIDDGYKIEAPSHRKGQSHLQSSSNRLIQSFLSIQKNASGSQVTGDSVLEIKTENERFKVTLGTRVPYAHIQEYGGQIMPTAKSARFFMAMWLKTGGATVGGKILGDPFWFAMFIHAKRGQPTVIPAHHYTDRGVRDARESVPKSNRAVLDQYLQMILNGQ